MCTNFSQKSLNPTVQVLVWMTRAHFKFKYHSTLLYVQLFKYHPTQLSRCWMFQISLHPILSRCWMFQISLHPILSRCWMFQISLHPTVQVLDVSNITPPYCPGAGCDLVPGDRFLDLPTTCTLITEFHLINQDIGTIR